MAVTEADHFVGELPGLDQPVVSPPSGARALTALHPRRGDGRILTRYFYDSKSRLTEQVDDNNNRTRHEYDAHDRKTKTWYGEDRAVTAAEATLYGVDESDPATDPHGNDATLADRNDTETYEEWEYDLDSNVTLYTDQNKTRHAFDYDGANRRVGVDVDHEYNDNPNNLFGDVTQRFEYDGLGRSTKTTDATLSGVDVVCEYVYDTLSRTLNEGLTVGFHPRRVQAWKFVGDRADAGALQATAQLFDDQRELRLEYDANNRLTDIEEAGDGNKTIVSYDYVGPGTSIARRTFGSGQVETRGYDGIHRLTSLSAQKPDAGGPIVVLDLAYGYDGEHLPRYEDNLQHPIQSERYSFDSARRNTFFVRGTLSADKSGTTAFASFSGDVTGQILTLDGLGNWAASFTNVDGVNGTETRDHTNFNEIDQVDFGPNFTYDANGNLTGDGERTYRWDAVNRLREVRRASDGQVVALYEYDTQNRRVRAYGFNGGLDGQQADGEWTFYYAGWRLCAQFAVVGGVEPADAAYQYVWGAAFADELVCRDDGGVTLAQLNDGVGDQRQYQHAGRNWNIRTVSDESGQPVERYLYSAYGRRVVLDAPGTAVRAASVIDQRYGYTGQRYDAETGLWYFKQRYYAPELGRFISRDPAGYVDGMSLYMAYFVLTGVDPLGLCYASLWELHDPRTGGAGGLPGPEPVGGTQPTQPLPDLDSVQTALDGAGFAGPAGPFADGANAVISVARGNFVEAGINVVAMVPIWGDALKAGRMTHRGGKHADMKRPTGDGLDSHHTPDRNADPTVSADDGPAIQMDPDDHRATSSYGRAGEQYRKENADMIAEGRHRDVMSREIRDVRRAAQEVSGDRTKYNSALKEMVSYAKNTNQLPAKPARPGWVYPTAD